MLQAFKKHVDQNFSFLQHAKLLVAVSGGIDSVVLTHLLYQLSYTISIAHCNFKLRGSESDKDEVFVKNLSKDLKKEFFINHFNTKEYSDLHKLSVQESARNLRYGWFAELVEKNQFDYILTAHNLDDSLETLIINLTRGSGLKGFLGIPEVNNTIVRPLLGFSRSEIHKYAVDNNIQWREDQSNKDSKYVRNKIRHEVIPVLKSINSELLSSFKQTLNNLKDSNFIINDLIKKEFILKNNRIRADLFLQTKNPKAYLYYVFNEYGFTAWDDLFDLLTAQSGKQIFSNTHRILKDREYLLLSTLENTFENEEHYVDETTDKLSLQNNTYVIQTKEAPKTFTPKPFSYQFDKDLLKFPLKVRKWQKGDYFYPLGMSGKKKLSKFFIDQKYSLLEKENIWVLLSHNQIVWVIGKRQDDRYKITSKTKQILEISLVEQTNTKEIT